jgi:uncharacterized membrane protein YhiD involved in acid resistance
MSIGVELTTGIFALSELLLKLLRRIKVTYRIGGIQIEFEEEKSIDERIAKIDEARTSMVEALTAIDQLHQEAESNKTELKKALRTLAEAEKNKNELEEELKNIRQVMQSDVTTFRKIAGIPSEEEIKKERVLGFFTGVLASVVASLIVWAVATAWPHAVAMMQKNSSSEVQEQQTPNNAISRPKTAARFWAG